MFLIERLRAYMAGPDRVEERRFELTPLGRLTLELEEQQCTPWPDGAVFPYPSEFERGES